MFSPVPSKYEGMQEAGSRFQSNNSSAGKSFGNKYKKFDKKAHFKKTFGNVKKKFGKGKYDKFNKEKSGGDYGQSGHGGY